jgi:DNA-directed RNA polymerase specialized sigma24 family protein
MELPLKPLLEALAAGLPDAYAKLFDQLGGRLVRTAAAILGSADEAEDAVQDLFVNLARARHCFAQVRDLEAYVFACLRHVVAGRLTARRTEQLNMQRLALVRRSDRPPIPESGDHLDAALPPSP